MAVCQTTKMSGMGIDRDSHCLQQSGLQGLQCGLGRHDLSLDRHGFLSFLLLPHLDSGAAPPVGASLLAMAVCQTTKMSGMGIDRDSHCLQQSGLQGLQCGLGRHDLSLDRHGFLSFLLLPHLDSGAAPCGSELARDGGLSDNQNVRHGYRSRQSLPATERPAGSAMWLGSP